MRQFIAQLLILSVLITNVAWAMDECSLPYSNETSALVQSGGSSSDNQSDSICDVPCVGWLHLVAITPDTQFYDSLFSHQQMARVDISFHSLDKMPPVRPPQI